MGAVVAIVGVGIGLAFALWPSSASAATSPKDATPEPEVPPEQPKEKQIAPRGISPGAAAGAAAALLGPGTAGALGGGAAAAAVGAAAVAATVGAGAAIGAGITGDALGAVGGAVGTVQQMFAVGGGFTFITGQAGNIGRVLGREIDRVLNGSGVPGASGSRVAIEAAGFVAGLATVSTAATMIPFIGQVFVLVVAIASAAQDAARVAYGQQGLVTDATAEALGVFNSTLQVTRARVFEVLQLAPNAVLAPADELRIKAIAIAQAIGFAESANEQRERAWLLRPRGIGQTEASHRAWGEARGLYLVPTNLEAVRRAVRNAMGAVDPRDQMTAQEWDEHRARGAKANNWKNYLAAMGEPFEPFASAADHAALWARRGAFLGAVNLQGELVEGLVRIDWRRSQVERRVVIVEEAAATGTLPTPLPGAPATPGNLGVSNLKPPGNFGTGTTSPPKPPGNFALPAPAPPPAQQFVLSPVVVSAIAGVGKKKGVV